MDDMQVDTGDAPDTSTVTRNDSSRLSSSTPRSVPAPSKPLAITGTSSPFKPTTSTCNHPPRSDHKPAFTPFAPPAVANMYSQKVFKPLAASSPPRSQGPPAVPPPSKPSIASSVPASAPASIAPSSQMSTGDQQPSKSDTKNTVPLHRTPFKPSAPVQIPRPPTSKPALHQPESSPTPRSLGSALHTARSINLSPTASIPQSLPNIQPSYPAILFGGLSADDEHVTVWEPHTGKTVAGNAAPYRRNLSTWLERHPGWEEKADELKSSKRRSAARRARSAADAFAALCCYPVAAFLAHDAGQRLQALGDGDHLSEETMMTWGADDFVRLQEAIFRLGQECHRQACNLEKIDKDRWATVCAHVGGAKTEGTVVSCAHHMLTRGIAKSVKELGGVTMPGSFGAVAAPGGESSGIGSPASLNSYDINMNGTGDGAGPSSLPALQGGLGASFLERSFRAPREPRVTVWNPANGRTISGNAAPCRRNLEAWMQQHPGWKPKEEGQLSSSRRNRSRKIRPSSMPSAQDAAPSSVEPESPHFSDALQGLLFLSRSPTAYSPTETDAVDTEMGEEVEEDSVRGVAGSNGSVGKKMGMTSSVSSSSAEEGNDGMSGEEDGEDDSSEPKAMEL